MSFHNLGENLTTPVADLAPVTTVQYPTPNESDLYHMYTDQGLVRYGIVAAIMRKTDAGDSQLLLMPHKGSPKTRHGSLGAPGETSLVNIHPVTGKRDVV